MSDLYFLDDFCGTGEQFDKFLKGIEFEDYRRARPDLRVTYLVTTIHTSGLKHIRDNYPYVSLKWAELLEKSHGALAPECLARYQVDGFETKINTQYAQVLEQTGLPTSGKMAEGFGELGLAYAFAHATPNNTLPIFWMETPRLTPLLDR